MEWTDEKTLSFIEMYRLRPQLWDTTNTYHKNKNRRHDSLTEIAVSFGIDKEDVERKIRNLQSQFSRERKRELESKKTGSGAEEPYVSKWFAYKAITFLADRNKPRRTVDNVDNSIHHDEENSQGEDIESQPESCREELPPASSPSCFTAERKSAKRKQMSDPRSPNAPIINEAMNLMRSIQNKRVNSDEFSLFGDQIAIKMRRLSSPRVQFFVQNEINRILFEAEMGYYDQPNIPIRAAYHHMPQYNNLSMPSISSNHEMQAGYHSNPAVQPPGWSLSNSLSSTVHSQTKSPVYVGADYLTESVSQDGFQHIQKQRQTSSSTDIEFL